jgi:pimeloyl-ACP methyl ester carboxylesterase
MNRGHVLGLSGRGFHRVHYTDWGNPDSERVVICVHGLTRNGRDFDALAQALEPDFRVICPDIVGRGKSDWLDDKDQYGYPQYCADMAVLIARVTAVDFAAGGLQQISGALPPARGKAKKLFWVGTSMGGLIGMMIATQKQSPISKLVLNDVGMVIPRAALERIGNFVGKDPRFKSYEELESYVRTISAPFGPLTDAQWRHLVENGSTRHEDGSWGLSYDPGIGHAFRRGVFADVDLRGHFDGVTCPTLLLRGAESDLLTRETAVEMTQRGPRPRLVEFEGVGHAPMLMAVDQMSAVKDFLRAQ